MTLLTTIAILCLALSAGVLGQNDFEIEFQSKADCDSGDAVKGVQQNDDFYVENSKYRVLFAKTFWVDSKGKIVGLAACKVPASKRCSFVGEKKGEQYLFLAVTLKKSSVEDQNVNYAYNDKTFQLTKLTPPGTPGDIHEINTYLYPASATIYKSRFNAAECRSNRAEGLLSGHGYFVAKLTSGSIGKWQHMYFDPPNVGYYIRVPSF